MINVTTKYQLTSTQRKALIAYVNGDVGIIETSKILKTGRHNIDRFVASIIKHAVRTKKLDFKSIIKHY